MAQNLQTAVEHTWKINLEFHLFLFSEMIQIWQLCSNINDLRDLTLLYE